MILDLSNASLQDARTAWLVGRQGSDREMDYRTDHHRANAMGLYRACSPMNIIDPVLSELLSRLGVDTDFGDAVLTCPETQGPMRTRPCMWWPITTMWPSAAH